MAERLFRETAAQTRAGVELNRLVQAQIDSRMLYTTRYSWRTYAMGFNIARHDMSRAETYTDVEPEDL